MKKLVVLTAMIFMAAAKIAYTAPSPKKIPPLSLQDAILLAVRDNPNVQTSQLNDLAQKYNLDVQEWQFQPHFSFQAGVSGASNRQSGNPVVYSKSWNAQPAASLLTGIGTQITATASNTAVGNYNPGLSLQITQPLLRGFGKAVVEAALLNARDSSQISRLNVEGVLRNTVSAVINAYLDVVNAQRTIKIDEDALKRAKESVKQTEIYIKAGHKAGTEILTVQANVASAQAQLQNDRNNLLQTRYALLTAIGIDPDSDVTFQNLDVEDLINKFNMPDKEATKREVLNHDIQYQVDNITLHGATSRSLLVAEDNSRWQLNATATVVAGNGSGGGQNAGFNSLVNGANQSNSVALTLNIPIDDHMAKQAVANAKIALQEAEINLRTEKWAKETGAINGWNQVESARQSQRYAEAAEQLQEKTYNMNYQKYLHGLIDSLELQSAQIQLIQAQQTLLSSRIAYLKALVNMDLMLGNTLKTWNVKVRL